MLLVKLGGSVVTEKARLRTPRRAAIRRLATELASVRQPLLVVHGAGSYGHILASRHRLKEGGSTSAKRAAAARVQADVRELDRLVVDALNRAGFAAVPIAPSVVLTLDDGGVSSMDLTPFLEFSSLGFTPVTLAISCGTCGADSPSVPATCSCSSWPGRSDPIGPSSRRTSMAYSTRIRSADRKRTYWRPCHRPIWGRSNSRPPGATDVTGSIEGKVRRMFEIAEHVDECMIVNGNVKNEFRDALRGKRVVGTRIVRGPEMAEPSKTEQRKSGTCEHHPERETSPRNTTTGTTSVWCTTPSRKSTA